MKIRNMILRENELEGMIEFLLEELEMMIDLMEVPKYQNSTTLIEKFTTTTERVNKLIKEKQELKHIIDALEEMV